MSASPLHSVALTTAPPCVAEANGLGDGQGSERWFTEAVHPHDAALKAYLRGKFPDETDVDEVVQESYVRVWKARGGERIQSIKAFLFRVASNLALDRLRKHRAVKLSVVGDLKGRDAIDERTDVEATIHLREKERLLAEALAALPRRSHDAIVHCKLEGLSHREAAEHMGISERTVDELLWRGMKRLGEELRKRGLDSFYP